MIYYYKALINNEYVIFDNSISIPIDMLRGSLIQPSILQIEKTKDSERIVYEQWYYKHVLHRENGPAQIILYDNKSKQYEWYLKGKRVNEYNLHTNKTHILYPYYITWNKEKYPLEYEALLKSENTELFD